MKRQKHSLEKNVLKSRQGEWGEEEGERRRRNSF